MRRSPGLFRAAIVPALLAVLITAAVPAVSASQDHVWEALVRLALDAFRERRFGDGIELTRAAHAQKPHPNLLFNIAWAYHSWGEHCAEAEASFQQLFEFCPDCETRALAEERHAVVREACSPRAAALAPTPGGFLEPSEDERSISGLEDLASAESLAVLVLVATPRIEAVLKEQSATAPSPRRLSHLIDELITPIRENTLLRVVALDPEREEAFRACAGDPDCLFRSYRRHAQEADLLLVVSFTDVGDLGTLASLTLGDVRRSSPRESFRQQSVFRSSAIDALQETKAALRPLLSDEFWGRFGAVEVRGSAAADGARAELTGTGLQCIVPCRLDRVPLGEQRLQVVKEGYEPWRTTLVIQSGSAVEANAELVEDPDRYTDSPWFWVVATTVVVASAIGLSIAIAASSDSPKVVCIADPKSCE